MGSALQKHAIRGVLTGGACASMYTRGVYVSGDVDFILSGKVQRATLDRAMASLGFQRKGDRYLHPDLDFFVEFPPGPLAIGADHAIRPVTVRSGANKALSLSATDSCRDRLAAYFHWQDQQSLVAAVNIALMNDVRWAVIRSWSKKEGHLEKFEEFRSEVRRRRRSLIKPSRSVKR